MAGIHCAICKGKLSYDQHEQAAMVACSMSQEELRLSPEFTKELQDYLLASKAKAKAEEDGYAGFAFMRAK